MRAKYILLLILVPILFLAGYTPVSSYSVTKIKVMDEKLPDPAQDSIRFKIIQYGESREEAMYKAFYVADSFSKCYTLVQLNSIYTVDKNGPYWTTELIVDIKKSNVFGITGTPKNFD